MVKPRFLLVAVVIGSFVGGVLLSRWFDFQRNGHGNVQINSSMDEPLITAQLLRAALNRACENPNSRNFYGPGAYSVPRSLWDEVTNPTSTPPDQAKKSPEEIQDEKGFQKEIEGHQREMENACRNRDQMTDAELVLPSQWSCELIRFYAVPDQAKLKDSEKMEQDWENNFLAKHHLSEERFNDLFVAFELALQAIPEGKLRQDGQCGFNERAKHPSSVPNARLMLHDIEDDTAQGSLCAARADSANGDNLQKRRWLLHTLLDGFAESNNISTERAREIMEQAIHDAKAKDSDLTWSEYCASTDQHNDDRTRLDLSVFERAH